MRPVVVVLLAMLLGTPSCVAGNELEEELRKIEELETKLSQLEMKPLLKQWEDRRVWYLDGVGEGGGVKERLADLLYLPLENFEDGVRRGEAGEGEKYYVRSDSKKGHFATVVIFSSAEGGLSFLQDRIKWLSSKPATLPKKTRSPSLLLTACATHPILPAYPNRAVIIYNHLPDLRLDSSAIFGVCPGTTYRTFNINLYPTGAREGNFFYRRHVEPRLSAKLPPSYRPAPPKKSKKKGQ